MGQDPRQIRSEIGETRARMDDTIDALAYKTDLPARLGDKVDTVKEKLGDVAGAVAQHVTDASQTVSDNVGGALGTAQQAVASAVASVTKSKEDTTTAQEKYDEESGANVQED